MSTTTAIGAGRVDKLLSRDEVSRICAEAFDDWALDGKRVLVLIPDRTRTCPMDVMFETIHGLLARRVARLDFMIALGTHVPLSPAQIGEHLGIDPKRFKGDLANVAVFNHDWKDARQMLEVGQLTAADVRRITKGLFEQSVRVQCNRRLADYDVVVICGPVFPHEVVGFSGGNKYIFPGVAAPEIIDFFHWVASVITNYEIIGRKHTPVREIVDRCAQMLPVERRALCMVVKQKGLAGLYAGTPEAAWSDAADLSAQIHVEYRDKPFKTVLSCCPPMYEDLWTGGKCMYKVEPVVADGGHVIIYAPHIREVSKVHGQTLMEVGYHVRDYFLKQWDRFKHYPWGELAHSTHVKGLGTFENGVEKPRIKVSLASAIPEAICRQIDLGYIDPASIEPSDYAGREDEGILLIPKAGEILYRVRD